MDAGFEEVDSSTPLTGPEFEGYWWGEEGWDVVAGGVMRLGVGFIGARDGPHVWWYLAE